MQYDCKDKDFIKNGFYSLYHKIPSSILALNVKISFVDPISFVCKRFTEKRMLFGQEFCRSIFRKCEKSISWEKTDHLSSA